MRRRELLAGATAAAVTLRAAPARAASDEGGLLLGLWQREVGLALAYRSVVHADPVFSLLRAHARDHAAAIATELAAVGLGTPKPPETPEDLDIAAQRLATSARGSALANAVLVEEGMVAVYTGALPALPDAKIAMTAATILAAHAQQLFIVRRAAGVT
jgi:hypothetical protein